MCRQAAAFARGVYAAVKKGARSVKKKGLCLQVDFLLSRLSVMKERVEAPQALVAIDLDQRRNELVAFDLVRLGLHHEQQCLASRAGTLAMFCR